MNANLDQEKVNNLSSKGVDHDKGDYEASPIATTQVHTKLSKDSTRRTNI